MIYWTIDPASTLRVRARSTLHEVASNGTGLSGTVSASLNDIEGTAAGEVTVALKSQSFGDRLRDMAMHRHIEVKRYPTATFVVTAVKEQAREPWSVEVTGQLSYRQRDLSLTFKATGTVDDQRLHASAEVPLRLSNLGVKAPKMLFLKVEDDIVVQVDLHATAGPSPK
jgi:polyisoprenoid-binding protein YceI